MLRDEIVTLLHSTARDGMDGLVEWLDVEGFFTSPASTKYHGCYEGGLAQHSMNVYELLREANALYRLGCPQGSIIIAALLHDVCKVGAYRGTKKPYVWNRSQPAGHGLLSVARIMRYIKLDALEEAMIKYHMGVYGLTEFDAAKGEYTLRGGALANAWHHFPIVKVMYFCDEFATLKEMANETPCAPDCAGQKGDTE